VLLVAPLSMQTITTTTTTSVMAGGTCQLPVMAVFRASAPYIHTACGVTWPWRLKEWDPSCTLLGQHLRC
jgi:hypothetical protein